MTIDVIEETAQWLIRKAIGVPALETASAEPVRERATQPRPRKKKVMTDGGPERNGSERVEGDG